MNKSDFFIVLILLILMGVWMYINPRYISPPSVINEETKNKIINNSNPSEISSDLNLEFKNASELNIPERIFNIENNFLKLEISSIDGGIKSSTLLKYKSSDSKNSKPIILNFNNWHALSLSNSKFEEFDGFEFKKINSNQLKLTKSINNNVKFERTILLNEDYFS